MNREKGTEVARTEVTQHLIKYIKDNACTDPENKKLIKPDEKLKHLLNVGDDDEVTYFSLQRLMNRHFPKVVAPLRLPHLSKSLPIRPI